MSNPHSQLQDIPEQAVGRDLLLLHKKFFLLDEPGFGKTIQALMAANVLGPRYMQVICPAEIVPQWQREIARFPTKNKYAYTVSSYNKAKKMKVKPDLVIIDEGHFLKNRKAQRTKRVLGPSCTGVGGIIEGVPNIWVLTGSIMPNNPSELWSLLRAIRPDVITYASGNIMTYWQFVERFCTMQNNGFADVITGGKNMDILRKRLELCSISRIREGRKAVIGSLVLDAGTALKELKEIEESEECLAMQQALAKYGVDGLEKMSPHMASLRRLTGLAKVAPVVKQIKQEMEGGLKKLLVIAYHRDVINQMADMLNEAGIGTEVLIGGMTAKASDKAKETFAKNKDCKVLIGQITKAGTGTDGLQHVTNQMMLVESSWVPEENKQIIARLDRRGQAKDVLVRFVTLAGSLDEKISAAVRRKTADIIKLLG